MRDLHRVETVLALTRTLHSANMFNFIPRSVIAAQNSSLGFYQSCLLLAKRDKKTAPAFRFACESAGRALSTSSIRFCEKKSNVASSDQEETTNADKHPDATESSVLAEQKSQTDSKVVAEQNVEPGISKTVDGRATHQDGAVKTEQLKATPKQVNSNDAKSGKESLLDLLGAMKVEVTNKRKLQNLKFKQSHESVSRSKAAAMESTISMFQQATVEASSQSGTLDPELVAAASAVASTLPNGSQAESELLKKLREHETVTEAQKKGDMSNLGVIIADMKVGKMPNRQNAWPANQIRFDDDGQGYTHDRGITAESDGVRRKRNLFKGKRLNIFSATTDEEKTESAVARPTLWDIDFANQLSTVTNQMPRNGLEEMIQWTKEGKMWRYPINNEDGLEEEASVSFYEHIFLEKHLEEGFPRQGPVRHFMELVVAGLSKNPYLTVQQKKEHIFWFRDYFHQKEEVLKEADVYLN